VFPAKSTLTIVNRSTQPWAFNSTPTINGCNGAQQIDPGGWVNLTSDGTNLECLGFPGLVGTVSALTRTVSGATDTLLASDCGHEVLYTNAGATTVTIPAAIVPNAGRVCGIRIRTTTANKVSVNGTAVTAATLVSPDSYTGTRALAGAFINLSLENVSSVATAYLDGFGS
jgi:hypothetical protein